MDKEKVLKLAELARIRLSETEAEGLSREFGSILNYVGSIGAAAGEGGNERANFATRNVMREDGEGHESGIYTEVLLSAAPAREGNYLKVKKIL